MYRCAQLLHVLSLLQANWAVLRAATRCAARRSAATAKTGSQYLLRPARMSGAVLRARRNAGPCVPSCTHAHFAAAVLLCCCLQQKPVLALPGSAATYQSACPRRSHPPPASPTPNYDQAAAGCAARKGKGVGRVGKAAGRKAVTTLRNPRGLFRSARRTQKGRLSRREARSYLGAHASARRTRSRAYMPRLPIARLLSATTHASCLGCNRHARRVGGPGTDPRQPRALPSGGADPRQRRRAVAMDGERPTLQPTSATSCASPC